MKRHQVIGLIILSQIISACASGQQYTDARSREAALQSLDYIHTDLKRSYYDRELKGVDLEAGRVNARSEIERATTAQQRYAAIARYLDVLDDSHTFFIAPRSVTLWDYGFGVRFFGETPYVLALNAGSSADSLGLRTGDEIVSFNGEPLHRNNYTSVIRDFLARNPIPNLALSVRAPNRAMSELLLTADTMAIYRLSGDRFRRLLAQTRDSLELAASHVQVSIRDTVFLWRMPQFTYGDGGIDDVMKRARAHKILILDLRGNGGGAVKTLNDLVGHFVDHEVLVGALNTRQGKENFTAKPEKNRFTGRLFVLVDSETASAAEVFARLMQLEKRGIVVGDRTAGAVMASNLFIYDAAGLAAGASITVSDFALYNGERLERIGVAPDVPIIPTAQQIAERHDPVLAYALQQAGISVSPAGAARLLPMR